MGNEIDELVENHQFIHRKKKGRNSPNTFTVTAAFVFGVNSAVRSILPKLDRNNSCFCCLNTIVEWNVGNEKLLNFSRSLSLVAGIFGEIF